MSDERAGDEQAVYLVPNAVLWEPGQEYDDHGYPLLCRDCGEPAHLGPEPAKEHHVQWKTLRCSSL